MCFPSSCSHVQRMPTRFPVKNYGERKNASCSGSSNGAFLMLKSSRRGQSRAMIRRGPMRQGPLQRRRKARLTGPARPGPATVPGRRRPPAPPARPAPGPRPLRATRPAWPSGRGRALRITWIPVRYGLGRIRVPRSARPVRDKLCRRGRTAGTPAPGSRPGLRRRSLPWWWRWPRVAPSVPVRRCRGRSGCATGLARRGGDRGRERRAGWLGPRLRL